MGKIIAVCISEKKGTKKHNINTAKLIENFGIENDAHAGMEKRQVSFLSYDKVKEFCQSGAKVGDGDFGENILAEGIDFKTLPIGTIMNCNGVRFEVTQIGKQCHAHCEIYHQVGDCIMPREGIFAKVLNGGTISQGDELIVEK